MHTITPSFPQSADSNNFLQLRSQTTTSALTRLSTDARTSADITIRTAEGDKVTLSTSTASQAAYFTYDAQGRLPGQHIDIHAEALRVASSSRTSIIVEGDLNDAELADIQRLMDNLQGMVHNFLAGDIDATVLQALDTGDLDALAGFDASFAYTRHIAVEQRYTTQQIVRQTPIIEPEAAPVSPAPITGQGIQHLINRMLKAIRESRADAEKLADSVSTFTAKLLDKLTDEYGLEAPKPKLVKHILGQIRGQV